MDFVHYFGDNFGGMGGVDRETCYFSMDSEGSGG